MMNFVVLVILISLISFEGSLGGKIIERFGGSYPKDGRRLMFFQDMYIMEGELKEALQPTVEAIESGLRVFKYLNCSKISLELSEEPLAMLPNGTYTSVIGFIQRNEADILTFFVRPDSLPHEPGIIGPVIAEADVSILSARVRMQTKISTRQLTVFFKNFPGINYAFILLTTIICMVMYLIMEHRDMSLIERISTTNLLTLLEKTSHGFMDSINLDASRTTGRIVWGSFLIFLFFAVYGLFLSKIGADMVTVKEPQEFERPDELIENDNVTIMTVKQVYLHRLLDDELESRPESLMAQVKRKMIANPKAVLDIKKIIGDPQKAVEANLQLLAALLNNEAALLQENVFLKYYQRLSCAIYTEDATLLRMSQATYAPGTLNFIYSHKIDPKVRQALDYHLHVQHEGSLISAYIESAEESSISFWRRPHSFKTIQCQQGVNETLADMRLGFGSFRQITTNDYEATFLGVGCVFALSFVVLVAEILRSMSQRKGFRKKNRATPELSCEIQETPHVSEKKKPTLNDKQEHEKEKEVDMDGGENAPASSQIEEPKKEKKVTSMKRPKTSPPMCFVDENVNRSAKTITRVDVH